MISKEEIKKLADLARIDIEEREQEKLALEMGTILEYVGQVSHFAKASDVAKAMPDKSRDEFETTQIQNIMREDSNPTESETYNKELITEFPNKEGNYLKIKKIL